MRRQKVLMWAILLASYAGGLAITHGTPGFIAGCAFLFGAGMLMEAAANDTR